MTYSETQNTKRIQSFGSGRKDFQFLALAIQMGLSMVRRIRTFTLKYDLRLNGFDDEGVRRFLSDKELLEVRDYFFVRAEEPHLLLVVIYSDHDSHSNNSAVSKNETVRKKTSSKDMDIENPDDLRLYHSLREWRNNRAKDEGIPVYVIATNRMLADCAVKRPRSITALGEVAGLGENKLKAFGKDILAQIPVSGPEADSSESSCIEVVTEINDDSGKQNGL